MLPSKRPLYMGSIVNAARKSGTINTPTLIIICVRESRNKTCCELLVFTNETFLILLVTFFGMLPNISKLPPIFDSSIFYLVTRKSKEENILPVR